MAVSLGVDEGSGVMNIGADMDSAVGRIG